MLDSKKFQIIYATNHAKEEYIRERQEEGIVESHHPDEGEGLDPPLASVGFCFAPLQRRYGGDDQVDCRLEDVHLPLMLPRAWHQRGHPRLLGKL